MNKYVRVYRALVCNSFSTDVVFRGNFFGNIVASFASSLLTIASVIFIFNNFESINGWSKYEVLLVSSVWIIVNNISVGIFLRGLRSLPSLILTGELDSYLLKPIDAQFLISVFSLIPGNFVTAAFGVFIAISCLSSLGLQVGILNLILFPVVVALSVSVFYSLWLTTVSLNFYFNGADNLVELAPVSFQLGRYPHDSYRGLGWQIFLAVFPLALITTVPAQVILGKVSSTLIIILLFMSLFSAIAGRIFWKASIKKYSSAGG